MANSELSVCLQARRSAQPAFIGRFCLARSAKGGLLAGPANSPPVSGGLRKGCRFYAKSGDFRCKTLFQNPAER